MHVVVFQFRPHPEHRNTYFEIVAELRPELQRVPGFLANERFSSRTDPHGLVSISLWEDEAAIRRWREHAGHRVAQARGKGEVFASYRLRVGASVEDRTAPNLLHVAMGHGLQGAESYCGVLDPDHRLVLGELAADPHVAPARQFALRIIRDYGPGSR